MRQSLVFIALLIGAFHFSFPASAQQPTVTPFFPLPSPSPTPPPSTNTYTIGGSRSASNLGVIRAIGYTKNGSNANLSVQAFDGGGVDTLSVDTLQIGTRNCVTPNGQVSATAGYFVQGTSGSEFNTWFDENTANLGVPCDTLDSSYSVPDISFYVGGLSVDSETGLADAASFNIRLNDALYFYNNEYDTVPFPTVVGASISTSNWNELTCSITTFASGSAAQRDQISCSFSSGVASSYAVLRLEFDYSGTPPPTPTPVPTNTPLPVGTPYPTYDPSDLILTIEPLATTTTNNASRINQLSSELANTDAKMFQNADAIANLEGWRNEVNNIIYNADSRSQFNESNISGLSAEQQSASATRNALDDSTNANTVQIGSNQATMEANATFSAAQQSLIISAANTRIAQNANISSNTSQIGSNQATMEANATLSAAQQSLIISAANTRIAQNADISSNTSEISNVDQKTINNAQGILLAQQQASNAQQAAATAQAEAVSARQRADDAYDDAQAAQTAANNAQNTANQANSRSIANATLTTYNANIAATRAAAAQNTANSAQSAANDAAVRADAAATSAASANSGVASNSQSINANATIISANATADAARFQYVESVSESNSEDISDLSSGVSQNSSEIDTNATTSASGISQNAADISSAATISVNGVYQNQAAISANATTSASGITAAQNSAENANAQSAANATAIASGFDELGCRNGLASLPQQNGGFSGSLAQIYDCDVSTIAGNFIGSTPYIAYYIAESNLSSVRVYNGSGSVSVWISDRFDGAGAPENCKLSASSDTTLQIPLSCTGSWLSIFGDNLTSIREISADVYTAAPTTTPTPTTTPLPTNTPTPTPTTTPLPTSTPIIFPTPLPTTTPLPTNTPIIFPTAIPPAPTCTNQLADFYYSVDGVYSTVHASGSIDYLHDCQPHLLQEDGDYTYFVIFDYRATDGSSDLIYDFERPASVTRLTASAYYSPIATNRAGMVVSLHDSIGSPANCSATILDSQYTDLGVPSPRPDNFVSSGYSYRYPSPFPASCTGRYLIINPTGSGLILTELDSVVSFSAFNNGSPDLSAIPTQEIVSYGVDSGVTSYAPTAQAEYVAPVFETSDFVEYQPLPYYDIQPFDTSYQFDDWYNLDLFALVPYVLSEPERHCLVDFSEFVIDGSPPQFDLEPEGDEYESIWEEIWNYDGLQLSDLTGETLSLVRFVFSTFRIPAIRIPGIRVCANVEYINVVPNQIAEFLQFGRIVTITFVTYSAFLLLMFIRRR